MSSFVFPDIYNFPPFFTLQPVVDSRSKQLELWCDLILNYCSHNGLFLVNVGEIGETDLFFNKNIKRKVDSSFLSTIFDHLVQKGRAEYLDSQKKSLLIFFKSREQWADILVDFVTSAGMNTSVCTVFELRQGSMTKGSPLHNVPHHIIISAVKVLQTRGQATLIEDESLDDVGVKFDVK
ncbi:hypothetical protein RCL1_002694 [Eukaryota sp. TZLM3-RCL]